MANTHDFKIKNGLLVGDEVTATAFIGDGAQLTNVANGLDWSTAVQSSDFTAEATKGYFVNTTSAAVTVTLPTTPAVGNVISIVDHGGNALTNNILINTNSKNLEGSTATAAIGVNLNARALTLVYSDATKGWVKLEQPSDTTNVLENSEVYTVGSGGQSSFNCTYTVGFVRVYVNGTRLAPADFTATDGSTVVLIEAALENDIVQLDAFGTFAVAAAAIANGGITEAKLATDAVSTDKIVDDAITAAKLGDDSVGDDAIGELTTLAFGSSKWTIELDAGDNDLNFKYNGTTVFKLASDGELVSAANITAFGAP